MMGTAAELNQFLAEVEKRAYAMAMVAVKNQDDALDIVQDVMMTLARKYAHKPAAEWRPLFFRILRNRITDFHRSRGVRRRIMGWFGAADTAADSDADPLDAVAGPQSTQPDRQYVLDGARHDIVEAVGRLPDRQQQAFMLRAWEGLDVKATAAAMGCGEGSVKTHYSRAVHALREVLEEYQNE